MSRLFGKTPEREAQEARESIQSLFAPPQHVGLSSCMKDGTESPEELRPHSKKISRSSAEGDQTKERSHVSVKQQTAPCECFPPCPIAGYRLTERGLVDDQKNASGPKTEGCLRWWSNRTPQPNALSKDAVYRLIHEMKVIEEELKYTTDIALPGQIQMRSLYGLQLLVNPLLMLMGVYLMTWKSVKLYRSALPRHSVVLTKVLEWSRWHLTLREKEEVAQRHRRFMRATNARVTLAFGTGAALTVFAWWTRPPVRRVDDAPIVQEGKKLRAYHEHTQAALKWLWMIYYRHPAYAGD